MPPSDPTPRLISRLSSGVTSSLELEQALELSQSSTSRALRKLINEGLVLRIGARRGARYGLRRRIEDVGCEWPLRRINGGGETQEIGTLYSLAADQYFLDPHPAAVAAGFAYGGISDGIPYFLQDQRPSGFLGRAVPRRFPELNLPQRTQDWNDGHYLRYLTQRGCDTIGDLILGTQAFDDYLTRSQAAPVIQSAHRKKRYPALVEDVMQGGLPGSSAHGEHPKFAAALESRSGSHRVIVKFSPPVNTPAGQRWADLLVAEHQAHRTLLDAGYKACVSQILIIGDRTYLEVNRFDRAGLEGRIGITSLWAIDTAQYGQLDHWAAAAMRLNKDRRIDADTLEQVRLVATFGALIANTDRHFGNLSFYDCYDGHFRLAPIYDMLPMLFAPEHDQIVSRTFTAKGPTSDTLQIWSRACELAEIYWRTLINDSRISADFRSISASCLQTLEALPRR